MARQYDSITVRNLIWDIMDFQNEECIRSYGYNHTREREYLKVDDVLDILRRREKEGWIAEQSEKG